MLKDKKANLALKQKNNKTKKPAEQQQKKQQLEKIKKSVKAGIVEPNAGGKKTNSKKKPVKEVEKSESEQEEVENEESDDEQMESDQEAVESEDEELKTDDEDEDEDESDEEDKVSEQEDAESDQEGSENEHKSKTGQGFGHTIFIKQLPVNVQRAQLVKMFEPYGKIMAIMFSTVNKVFFSNAVTRRGIWAIIVFDSPEAADKALVLDGTTLGGRKLFLKKFVDSHSPLKKFRDETNTVFVSGLKTINKLTIKKFFSTCGKVDFINLLKGIDGAACVSFKNPESTPKALKLDGLLIEEHPVKVVKYVSKNKKLNRKINPKSNKTKNKTEVEGEAAAEVVAEKSEKPKKAPKKKAKKSAAKE